MKPLFIIGIALLFSNISPEEKAQELILEQIRDTVLEWDSYRGVKFGSLDSLFSNHPRTVDGIVDTAYTPVHEGWKMVHAFTANSDREINAVHNIEYYFDLDITEITGVKNLIKD